MVDLFDPAVFLHVASDKQAPFPETRRCDEGVV
jgi:hypothetical protein